MFIWVKFWNEIWQYEKKKKTVQNIKLAYLYRESYQSDFTSSLPFLLDIYKEDSVWWGEVNNRKESDSMEKNLETK